MTLFRGIDVRSAERRGTKKNRRSVRVVPERMNVLRSVHFAYLQSAIPNP
jgi:hypothetical protein